MSFSPCPDDGSIGVEFGARVCVLPSRHPRVGGDPSEYQFIANFRLGQIPAFAGMTM
jgi:hypothetical protein